MTDQEPTDEAFHHRGDRLGKYLILRELGRGSMGVVYEAFQEGINRRVALKILPANITLEQKAVRRFHREAMSVGRLSHANIIQIYDNGTIEGTHYFAMEMVDGTDFTTVRCHDKETILRATTLVRDAARALAHAHREGVVHRDVKPSNIMLDKSGRVVVTDFGLARIKDSASLTSTDAVVGTPKYMSPEQILPGDHDIDGRADVYSLGATLYECITGHPPLDAPSIQAYFKAILEERPASPRRHSKQCPHDLATIVLRCLEKNPADRYAGADELGDDLDRFLKGERIKARPKGAVALGVEWVHRHRVIAGVSVVAVIALLLAVFLGGQVKKEKEHGDILARINAIRTEADLDLAAQAANELAAEYPGEISVRELVRDIHMRLADAVPNEVEPNWPLFLDYRQRAAETGDLWYSMGLIEAGRRDEAGALLGKLDADSEAGFLTKARLDLIAGNPEQAVARLSGRAGNLHPFTLLIHARALRALATKSDDAAQKGILRERAQELLRQARGPARERWLRHEIQFEAWQLSREMGRNVSLRDSVDDVGAIANRWWDRLSGVWSGASATEVSNLRVYVSRVLALAGLPESLAVEMEIKGDEWIKKTSPRERVIGQLLLAAAQLTQKKMPAAMTRFNEAENGIESEENEWLIPYMNWGRSLVYQARGDLQNAALTARIAIEFAVLDQRKFRDMEPLARHVALVMEDARAKNVDTQAHEQSVTRELNKLSPLPAWVSEVLSRIGR